MVKINFVRLNLRWPCSPSPHALPLLIALAIVELAPHGLDVIGEKISKAAGRLNRRGRDG
jgi:hypothetical protein